MGSKIININSESLSAEIMTLFYIYGQGRTPTSNELVDDKWIGRNNHKLRGHILFRNKT